MKILYAVLWDDAHGSDGTLAPHEIDHKPYKYLALGHFIRSDEVGVSLAHERGEDGKFRDITFIPRAIVVEEFSLGDLDRLMKNATRKKGTTNRPKRGAKPASEPPGTDESPTTPHE
jgi:hypothetical protein